MKEPTDAINAAIELPYDPYVITESRRMAMARLNNMIRDAAISALAIPGVTSEDVYLVMALVANEARYCSPQPNAGATGPYTEGPDASRSLPTGTPAETAQGPILATEDDIERLRRLR